MTRRHSSEQEQIPTAESKRPSVERLRAFGARLLLSTKGDYDNLPRSSAERIEIEGFAVVAPSFTEQLADTTGRDEYIESNAGYVDIALARMGIASNPENLSEQDSLRGLADFLTIAGQSGTFDDEDRKIAQDMFEHIAFIGEKELREATKGIADYWKSQLENHPDLQFLIQVMDQPHCAASDGRSYKSAGLVLEKILDNFSSEEIDTFTGRIIFDANDINVNMYTKAVYVDDWSTSGTQMRQQYWNLEYNRADGRIDEDEVCLVAASADQIQQGISLGRDRVLPVKAFYKGDMPEHRVAFEEAVVQSDAYPGYATGAHSSNDFTFDWFIGKLVHTARQKAGDGVEVPDILLNMPPLTRVTRKYHKSNLDREMSPGLSAIEQINRNNGHSYSDDSGQFVFVYQQVGSLRKGS